MKKIGYLLILSLSVMGAIGGIGYACYNGAYPMAKNKGVFHQTDTLSHERENIRVAVADVWWADRLGGWPL